MNNKKYIFSILLIGAIVCTFLWGSLLFSVSGVASADHIENDLNYLCRTYTELSNANGVDFYEYLQDYRRLTQDHMYTFVNATQFDIKHYKGDYFSNRAQYYTTSANG